MSGYDWVVIDSIEASPNTCQVAIKELRSRAIQSLAIKKYRIEEGSSQPLNRYLSVCLKKVGQQAREATDHQLIVRNGQLEDL